MESRREEGAAIRHVKTVRARVRRGRESGTAFWCSSPRQARRRIHDDDRDRGAFTVTGAPLTAPVCPELMRAPHHGA